MLFPLDCMRIAYSLLFVIFLHLSMKISVHLKFCNMLWQNKLPLLEEKKKMVLRLVGKMPFNFQVINLRKCYCGTF